MTTGLSVTCSIHSSKPNNEKSQATSLPIKERLAHTDALIDQIVY